MKKTLLTLLLGFSVPTFAAFIQEANSVKDIVDVKEMNDDTPVIIQGNIVQQLEDDKYIFRDNTDEVIVEIGKKAWHGVDVKATDTVQLVGEVDKDFSDDVEIDVKQVILVK